MKKRYKLQEAAEILAQSDTNGISKLLRALRKSAQDGSLRVYRSDSNIHYDPAIENESSAIKESNLLRSDTDVLSGGLTWVDREYDERLREVLFQVPDDLEVYWDDMNTWLEENEPRLSYRFPNPSILSAVKMEKQFTGINTSEQYSDKERHDITKERGSRRLILEYWNEIKLIYGDNADGRQVLRILKKYKDEYERPLKLKTIQNQLIKLRREKLIP